MIDTYSAIAEMRKLTAMKKVFSFSFVSFNRDDDKSEGLKRVEKASLRPAANTDEIANANYKLFYYDEIRKEPRNCWQPLIVVFNGQQVKLN